MGPAVDRLCRARERGEEVVVFGDYDADGVTATALLKLTLTQLGWRVRHYLPRRLEEGYGLSADATGNCLAQLRPTLLLAVDCGSTAVETIQELGASGVDVIVLDHHQVSCPPPQPVALVNPRLLTDSSAADAGLCSVGLAFKLSHALVKEGRRRQWPGSETYDLRPFLDLVALGTIADVVPLQGENRILVTAGLRAMARTSRVGLRALQTVAQVRQPPGVYEVGFQLAPRLNAAGRLETAAEALELLLTQTASEAQGHRRTGRYCCRQTGGG